MKKYILNYAWNGYPKGHVFEWEGKESINYYFHKEAVDLLVLSGALTEIIDEVPCLCPGCRTSSEVKKIEPLDTHFAYSTSDLRDKINEIINTKLK